MDEKAGDVQRIRTREEGIDTFHSQKQKAFQSPQDFSGSFYIILFIHDTFN